MLRLGRIGTGFRPRYFLPKELTGERIVREPAEARFQCLHRGELIVSFEDLAVERIAQRPLEPELAEEDLLQPQPAVQPEHPPLSLFQSGDVLIREVAALERFHEQRIVRADAGGQHGELTQGIVELAAGAGLPGQMDEPAFGLREVAVERHESGQRLRDPDRPQVVYHGSTGTNLRRGRMRCLPPGEMWHANSGEEAMIRVVLIDAMALVRSGIRLLLLSAGDFTVLGEGASAEDAQRLTAALRPDVLLMDRDIPGALSAVKTVKEANPTCDLIILTNHVVQMEAARMFEEGASGYVCKDIPGDILLTTLRAIRTPGAPRPILASGGTALPFVHVPPHRPQAPLLMNGLTSRERDILIELSTGSTDTEIAGRLKVHEGTVKTHIRHILRKLGVRNRTAAIAHALRERLIE